jgi:hypothetical protein
MGENLHEILQHSSNKEYIEDKDREGSNVEIEEMRVKKVHFRGKMMEEITGSCCCFMNFSSKSQREWRSKACNILSSNLVFKMMEKNIFKSSPNIYQ